jgi:hypothetical protein
MMPEEKGRGSEVIDEREVQEREAEKKKER